MIAVAAMAVPQINPYRALPADDRGDVTGSAATTEARKINPPEARK
jgi:hypothetical protein